jgi:TetR/AcrR family transcriptional regulator, cholesterol catabolism regulator
VKPKSRSSQQKIPRKRRAEVLDAAARVFHQKGYQATSIQDIADEVGILKGSVYYYISSKEDVLFELLQEVHEAALGVVVEAVQQDGDALQKIRAFVRTLAQFNADNRVRMGIFLHDFRSLSEQRRGEIVGERDQYDRILRRLISEGQTEGLVCADIDPKIATLAVMGMINTIYQWYRPAGGRQSEYIGSVYSDLVIGALSCTPQTHAPGHLTDGAAFPISKAGAAQLEPVVTPPDFDSYHVGTERPSRSSLA